MTLRRIVPGQLFSSCRFLTRVYCFDTDFNNWFRCACSALQSLHCRCRLPPEYGQYLLQLLDIATAPELLGPGRPLRQQVEPLQLVAQLSGYRSAGVDQADMPEIGRASCRERG